jgi:hypothetical protein
MSRAIEKLLKAWNVKKLADLFMCHLEDATLAVLADLMIDDKPEVAEPLRLTSVSLFKTLLIQTTLVLMYLMVYTCVTSDRRC